MTNKQKKFVPCLERVVVWEWLCVVVWEWLCVVVWEWLCVVVWEWLCVAGEDIAGAAHGGGFGVVVCSDCGANVLFASASDKESENEVTDRWNRRSGKGNSDTRG